MHEIKLFSLHPVVPACLPELSKSQDEFYEDGLYGVVSGWGLLNETDKTGSNSLQHVALPILRSEVCLGAYGKFVEMDVSAFVGDKCNEIGSF